MQKLLTIVVPVYKVEQYINKCLDSCIIYKADGSLDEEKMNQLEVIIVNDGTPDNSAELSREYTKRYPQTFRQIDKENGGHGSAWNVGLKEATGKYLRFLDSDDWLTNLDKLMEKLQDCEADLVFTPMNNVYIDGTVNEQTVTDTCNIEQPIEQFNFIENPRPNIADFWFVTYKREILEFNQPLFLEKCSYDDAVLFVAPFVKARTYIVYDFIVYNYLLGRQGQSVDPKVRKHNFIMILRNHNYMSQFWRENKNLDSFSSLDMAILNIIGTHASWLIADVLKLPYKTSQKESKSIISDMLLANNFHNSRQLKRYQRYPFCLFWILEKMRYIKNKVS